MTDRGGLDLFLTIYGGEYQDSAPSLFPSELTKHANAVSQIIIDQFPSFEPLDQGPIRCVLVNNGGMNTRIHSLGDGSRLIVIPVGMLIRVYWSAHAVLEFWRQGPNILISGSPLDDLPPEWYEIIGPLKPIFADYPTDSEFWTDMSALATLIGAREQNEDDVRSMTRICFVFLLWHELAHVQLGHFGLRKSPMLNDWQQWMDLDDKQLEAGLEGQADRVAAENLMLMLLGELEQKGDGQEELCRVMSLVTAGIMLMLGTFWPARKFVAGYRGLGYQHPLVRREMFVEAAAMALAKRDPALASLWKTVEIATWEEVIWATNRLALNASTRYKTRAAYTGVPIFTSLSYGTGYALPFIEAHHRRAIYFTSAADGILKMHTDLLRSVPPGVDLDDFLKKMNELGLEMQERAERALKSPHQSEQS